MNTNTSLDDPDTKRNGKIAFLPRPLREQINQLLQTRQPAAQLLPELNELPEVKAILAQHFGGRPISKQNLSQWKAGGYRDWLARQEILRHQSELAADVKEVAQTAKGLSDSLFGMLTLDYARLMTGNAEEDPENFEKKRKALGLLAQDIVRLRRCDVSARRVEIQEVHLEHDTLITQEQVLQKFTEWTQNPAVRKALILAPLERARRLRELYRMPPSKSSSSSKPSHAASKYNEDGSSSKSPASESVAPSRPEHNAGPTASSHQPSPINHQPNQASQSEIKPSQSEKYESNCAQTTPSSGLGESSSARHSLGDGGSSSCSSSSFSASDATAPHHPATLNLKSADELPQNDSHPIAVPSPLPSDGRGEGQGEVRVHGTDNPNLRPSADVPLPEPELTPYEILWNQLTPATPEERERNIAKSEALRKAAAAEEESRSFIKYQLPCYEQSDPRYARIPYSWQGPIPLDSHKVHTG